MACSPSTALEMVSFVATSSLLGALPSVTFGNSALEELAEEPLAEALAGALPEAEDEAEADEADADELETELVPQAVNVRAKHAHATAVATPVNRVLVLVVSIIASFHVPKINTAYAILLKAI
jgi:hypothetical protein